MDITIKRKNKIDKIMKLDTIVCLYSIYKYTLIISNVDFSIYKYNAIIKIIPHYDENKNNSNIFYTNLFTHENKIIICFKPIAINNKNKYCNIELTINNNHFKSKDFIIKAKQYKNKDNITPITDYLTNNIFFDTIKDNKQIIDDISNDENSNENIIKDICNIMRDMDNILSKFNECNSAINNDNILNEINNILERSAKYNYLIKNYDDSQYKLSNYIFDITQEPKNDIFSHAPYNNYINLIDNEYENINNNFKNIFNNYLIDDTKKTKEFNFEYSSNINNLNYSLINE